MVPVRNSACIGLIIVLLCFDRAAADTLSDGYITGRTVLPTGNPIGDVMVELRDPAGQFQVRTISRPDGAFRLPLLQPGKYVIQAEREGFLPTRLDTVNVVASAGTHVILALQRANSAEPIEEIEVVSSRVSRIDVFSSETVLTLDEAKIDILPLARDRTAVMLLTPGAVGGSRAFDNFDRAGRFAAMGGSSVAENAYYVNGMNVTNFRNGLGGSRVPFEFFQELQVKYGGISAEYGRATGGFVNAVTKRGTNDFRFGFGTYFEPGGLTASSPNSYASDGAASYLGGLESRSVTEGYAYASGPILRDRLFFYGIYSPRRLEASFADISTYSERDAEKAFWGLKLDYEINSDHLLEVTAFSDEVDYVDTSYLIDTAELVIGEERGDTTYEKGGTNWIVKYSGHLAPSFTLSALVGESEARQSQTSLADDFPVILDNRSPAVFEPLGSWISAIQERGRDNRDIARFDVEWTLGRHLLRAGVDHETNEPYNTTRYSGDGLWIYEDATPGEELPTGVVPDGVDQVARIAIYSLGGSFETITTSWYVEDSWRITDRLTLNLGLRNEVFDNRNSDGDTFIKITDQWAPRLGAVWNTGSEGSARVYGSFGRYFLPIMSTANIYLSGGEYFAREFYVLEGLNPDDTPRLGPQIGERLVVSDNLIRDRDELVDMTIKPMYQDEYTLGFETELGQQYVAGVNVVRRLLRSAIEDVAIDVGLNAWAQENGYDNFSAAGFEYYILANPGRAVRVRLDLDGDGIPETIDLTPDQLGFPDAQRRYSGVNLYIERIWDGNWFFRAAYTWSKNYGNFEGLVRSDNGQPDAGFTSNFDTPGLVDGAYGDLPNDRRHALRLYGSWQFADGWTAGANASWTSGKPINFFSEHPTDPIAAFYEAESFFTYDGELAPRGSGGRTPSVKSLDLSLTRELDIGRADVSLQLDVFNLFNWDSATAVREKTEFDNGERDLRYGLPVDFQAPRSVRLSARVDFE